MVFKSIYPASETCGNCDGSVERDLVPIGYCADCVLKGMEAGFRVQHFLGTITGAVGGGKYRYTKGLPVDVKRTVDLLRKLSPKDVSEKEICLLPEFSTITPHEMTALKIVATRLGPTEISVDELNGVRRRTLRLINSWEEAREISQTAPLLLITGTGEKHQGTDLGFEGFKERSYQGVAQAAEGFDVIIGWANVGGFFRKSEFAKFLASQRLKFEGCFLIESGKIVASKKLDVWNANVEEKKAVWIKEFLCQNFRKA